MGSTRHKSPSAYEAAKEMLPIELHPAFDDLLRDYKFAALKHHGKDWAAPRVLAELVLTGWRRIEGALRITPET